MSYLYSLENNVRKVEQDNLLDLITPILVNDDTLYYYPYIVSEVEEMRPDIICNNIYGHSKYIDELLTLNNILNPWSIKNGQIIYYVDEESILLIQSKPKEDQQVLLKNLVNPNKDTKKDPNRTTGENLPPSIKPSNLKDVSVDFTNKTIKIMDTLK